MIDSEKIIKHLITQYCDQQFKFTINLKILGSIHVIVDNNEVLTCLLDEKYFKPNANRGLIIPNNSYNPSSVLPLQTNPADHAMNLVNTLSQLQQQQRCQKMSVSTSGKSSSKSSTGSHSSSSSASSSSSYISSVLTDQSNQELVNGNSKHKRKRFTPKTNSVKSMNDDAASTGSSKKDSTENGSDNEHDNVSDVDEAVNGNSHELHNPGSHVSSSLASNMQRMTTNDTHEDAMDDMAQHETDYLDASHMDQTPLKRNKLDNDYEAPIESVTSNSNSNPTTYSNPTSNSSCSAVSDAEAAAAAAATLSLISVSSKLQSHHQNMPSNTLPATTNISALPTSCVNNQPDFSQASASAPNNGNKINHKKSKIKSIIEEYNKNEQFQLQLQQQEQARASAGNTNPLDIKSEDNYDQENQHSNLPSGSIDTNDIHNDSSCSENQLYMDEGGVEPHHQHQSDAAHGQDSENNKTTGLVGSSTDAHLQRQQQQHQLMMAAAAAIMNNNGTHNAAGVAGGYMPQLALNLAMAQQQQQQQNGVIPKKKKQRQNSMMSPSSSTSSSSGTTASSKKSSSSTGSKKNKRQTVAALTGTNNCMDSPAKQTEQQPEQPNDLQRNLVALAQQFGLNKDTANFDKIIQDMNVNNEKSKLLLTHTPQPANAGTKLSKKHHLLAARSANNSPHVTLPKQRGPKSKKATQFQDSSNLPPQNANQQNPMAQAAAAALRYQQLLSQVNGQTNGNTNGYNSPHKMYGNNNYQEDTPGYEHDENEETENNYNEQGGNDDKPNPGMMGTAGSINFKSLAATKQEPFAMNNSNTANVNPVGANLEFECSACDKKFKYYCYYKRHMDACHSDNPKYVCDTCNKSYKWEASFRQHLRSHHVTDGGNKEDAMQLPQQQNQNHVNGQDSVYNNLKMSFQNNENMMVNGNEDEDDEDYNEYTDDVDGQEHDIENQINQSQNGEPQQLHSVKMERDTEQMGAAGALASIADTIQNMIQAKSSMVPTSN